MTDLTHRPDNDLPIQISGVKAAEFVQARFGDNENAQSPTLTDYFNQYGIDAGLMYHNTPSLYLEKSLWQTSATNFPEDGQNGAYSITNGAISAGVAIDYNGQNQRAYIAGRIERAFGQSEWVAPTTETYELPVYDDDGNDTGRTETMTEELEGYQNRIGPVTKLYAQGYGDTAGTLKIEAGAEHSRTLTLNGRDFDFDGRAAAGYTNNMGIFGEINGQIKTAISSSTDLYASTHIRGAENTEFNKVAIGAGLITTALNELGNGTLGALPPLKIGAEHDINTHSTQFTFGVEAKF